MFKLDIMTTVNDVQMAMEVSDLESKVKGKCTLNQFE